jgi:hypothetical protein
MVLLRCLRCADFKRFGVPVIHRFPCGLRKRTTKRLSSQVSCGEIGQLHAYAATPVLYRSQ